MAHSHDHLLSPPPPPPRTHPSHQGIEHRDFATWQHELLAHAASGLRGSEAPSAEALCRGPAARLAADRAKHWKAMLAGSRAVLQASQRHHACIATGQHRASTALH